MKELLTGIVFLLLFSACSDPIKPDQLYGKWKYVQVDNADPRDSLQEGELDLQSPAIIFTGKNELIIEWGGKKGK
jgi:hypothetical protein